VAPRRFDKRLAAAHSGARSKHRRAEEGLMGVTGESPRPEEPAVQMLELLDAHFLVQALHVAAVLGIADLLSPGPKSVEELASAAGAHARSLHRLLRLLASRGIFREESAGTFALTPRGATLRSDVPDSVRDRALYVASPPVWQAWGDLEYSVRTGESAFEHAHGVSFYDYLTEHPAVGAPFNRFMVKSSEQHNAAIVDAYDFSPMRTVVDVGGGFGSTLTAILRAYPSLRGVLFDLLRVTEQVRLEATGVAERCEVVGGDMLQAVPLGGDGYILKRVLMDKADDASVQVLKNCVDAMADGGKVLVVDYIVPAGDEPSISKVLDVTMLVYMHGGRIRTEAEFRELFAAAGLCLERVIPTPSPHWHGSHVIMEAARS
jgi:hypothetical protein